MNDVMTNNPDALIKQVREITGCDKDFATRSVCDNLSRYIYDFIQNNGISPPIVQLSDARSMLSEQLRKPLNRRLTINEVCLRVVNMENILTSLGCIEYSSEVIA